MNIPLWLVDAFDDGPFTGNPAAVCLLDAYPSDTWLQQVASELNWSETAFVIADESPGSFRLRWFTPAAEVDLCGHATLASAHVLIRTKRIDPGEKIRFQTRSGQLLCAQQGDRITLDFPATPITGTVEPMLADQVRGSLGIDHAEVLQSKFDLVAVVADAEQVRDLTPDFHRMRQIATRGIIVTAKSQEGEADFISRFFAPRHNIDEDPVTGSAHCCLAPYWAEKLGKQQLIGYQASLRGGTVQCELSGDRVLLSGTARIVMEGNWLVDPD